MIKKKTSTEGKKRRKNKKIGKRTTHQEKAITEVTERN